MSIREQTGKDPVPFSCDSLYSAKLTRTVAKAVVMFSKNTVAPYLQHNYIVNMGKIVFEWDDRKNQANIKKHGISFEEAQTIFLDESAVISAKSNQK